MASNITPNTHATTLSTALPTMATTTKAIHADDTFTPHRAIAPAMHVAVTYRYTRDSKSLIPNDNTDVPFSFTILTLPNLLT